MRWRSHVDDEQYTPEQLQKSLFVDPGTSRNLLDRDGTEIYTDGKRGLQIYHGRHWMSYSDPVAPVETNAASQESLLVAVEFINRHGGWDGDYLMSEIEEGAVREMCSAAITARARTGRPGLC